MMQIFKLATYGVALLTPWFLGVQNPAVAEPHSSYKDLGTFTPNIEPPSTDVLLGVTPVALDSSSPRLQGSPQPVSSFSRVSNSATPSLGVGIVDATKFGGVPQNTTETSRARFTASRSYFPTQGSVSSSPLVTNSINSSTKVNQTYKPYQQISRTPVSQSSNLSQTPKPSPTSPSTPNQIPNLQNQQPANAVNPPPRRTRSASPGLTISNPSGYGADNFRGFAGFSYQSRTRFSNNSGGLLGGGRDGTAGFGFGLGDARDSVGLQVSYTVASFGGSRPLGSGGINAKLHTRFDEQLLGVAIGGDGIVNFGELPDDSPTEFNDFENTYYLSATKILRLRPNAPDPLSRVAITAGVGTGRFRSEERILNEEGGIGFFGSVALRIVPSINVITEWTGQDLAMGASIAPFRGLPLVITPAFRDIVGAGDGPRFVMGFGGAIGDVLSIADLIF